MGGWMRSPSKCQSPSLKSQLCLVTWHFLLKQVWNITLGRNSKMIKKDVEPESIIILIKSLSSSLIPLISKYHCRMPSPFFEIQIAQLPLNFIFNTLASDPPPPNSTTKIFCPLGQSLLSWQTRPQEIQGLRVTGLWVKFSTM